MIGSSSSTLTVTESDTLQDHTRNAKLIVALNNYLVNAGESLPGYHHVDDVLGGDRLCSKAVWSLASVLKGLTELSEASPFSCPRSIIRASRIDK